MGSMRYSIRALLIATLFSSLLFSPLAWRQAKRRQLIREILRAGGEVELDESSRVKAVILPQSGLHDVGASRFKLFPKLSQLSMLDVRLATDKANLTARRLDLTSISGEVLDDLERTLADSANRATQSSAGTASHGRAAEDR